MAASGGGRAYIDARGSRDAPGRRGSRAVGSSSLLLRAARAAAEREKLQASTGAGPRAPATCCAPRPEILAAGEDAASAACVT